MLRSLFVALSIFAAALMTGCCGGPSPCGVDCGNCDGVAGPVVPHRPFDRLRNARRGLLCGNGCGEVYTGEWSSYPPDCCDPCDNSYQCTPPIRLQPRRWLTMMTGWYGQRHPRGYAGCDECGDCISETDCGCNGSIEVFNESPGCASCMASNSAIQKAYSAPQPHSGQRTPGGSRTLRR